MNGKLAKLNAAGKTTLRIVRSVGGLIISQSENVSEAYAEHQLRLAKVDAAREFMVKEAASLAMARDNLRSQYFQASPEERIRIRRDLEDTDGEIRRLHVISKSLDELPEDSQEVPSPDSSGEQPEISAHWMDKFNEYARAHNEDWREGLLAKALALEAKNPGAIGSRALWLIGTIDEQLFHAYASLIDVASNIGGYAIPNHQLFNERPIPGCILGENVSIGNLAFMLCDLGLIGDTMSSKKTISKSSSLLTAYGTSVTLIKTKQPMKISGIFPTALGDKIASLYTPAPNELGLEIYNKWLDSLNETIVDKVVIATGRSADEPDKASGEDASQE